MFAAIRRGFGFLGQAIDMARRDSDLIKPSLYGLVVGTIVSVAGALPTIVVALLVGETPTGRVVLFVLGALLLFLEYAISYIFSGMTAYLIYGLLAEGDGRMDKAWATIRRDWLDILSLAAASTLVAVVRGFLRGRGRGGRRNLVGELVGDILERVWTTATYFVLPAMVIEDLNLGQALKRATYMIKNNLLLVAVTEIGVSSVVGLVGFVLGVISIAIGAGIFFAFASLGSTAMLVGAGLAVLAAGTLIALISAFSAYATTAYHTCMFLWAREAEKALAAGQSVQAAPAPRPVAAVLGA
ncbi:MAG TPA: hypothetical protein VI793_18370 [Anaerolineales bacterium]|nr:hypothetical protein [Anaerolineales bacterium]